MKGFRFKFQPILKVKEMEEQRIQEEYLLLRKAHLTAQERVNQLVDQKESQLTEIEEAEEEGTLDVAQALLCRDYLTRLRKEIAVSIEEEERRKVEMDLGFDRLIEKTKERKVMEKLKEKYKTKFVTEQLKNLQNELDDLSQGRFNHQKKHLEANR